jgi:predicted nucleotidyltransferase
MKLVEFTKEGLIVRALMDKPLRYTDLKKATELSDAWLSKKLLELQNLGIVISKGGQYCIQPEKLREALKYEKTYIARMIAQEIAKTRAIASIILFGSLVRRQRKEADIDLLVVTLENEFDPIQTSLDILRKFGVAVDILNIELKELLAWFYEPPPILFGILGGYEILYDEGYVRPLLKTLEQQTLKNWAYMPEEELWVKKELLPLILKPQKNT